MTASRPARAAAPMRFWLGSLAALRTVIRHSNWFGTSGGWRRWLGGAGASCVSSSPPPNTAGLNGSLNFSRCHRMRYSVCPPESESRQWESCCHWAAIIPLLKRDLHLMLPPHPTRAGARSCRLSSSGPLSHVCKLASSPDARGRAVPARCANPHPHRAGVSRSCAAACAA